VNIHELDFWTTLAVGVIDRLSKARIIAKVWKGRPLRAASAQSKSDAAPADIDVLVLREQIPAAVEVLGRLGFGSKQSLETIVRASEGGLTYQVDLFAQSLPITIDLHWAFGQRWSGATLPVEPILASEVVLHDDGIDWPWMSDAQLWNVQTTQCVKSRWAEPKSIDSFVATWDLLDDTNYGEALDIADTWLDARDLQLGLVLLEEHYGRRLPEAFAKRLANRRRARRDAKRALARRAAWDPEVLATRLTLEEAYWIWRRHGGSRLLFERALAPQLEDIAAAGEAASAGGIAVAKLQRLLRGR
jgi:hypothetical protein